MVVTARRSRSTTRNRSTSKSTYVTSRSRTPKRSKPSRSKSTKRSKPSRSKSTKRRLSRSKSTKRSKPSRSKSTKRRLSRSKSTKRSKPSRSKSTKRSKSRRRPAIPGRPRIYYLRGRSPSQRAADRRLDKIRNKRYRTVSLVPGDKRPKYFEYVGKNEKGVNSNKFWEITAVGNGYRVRYGKIGTKGRTATKMYSSPSTAHYYIGEIVHKKLDKGYVAVKKRTSSK